MKGSTQPMKRLLVLLPLLLVGCTNGTNLKENSDNSHTLVYKNVYYQFNLSKHKYLVYIEKNTYNVPPSNFYEIQVDYQQYYEYGKVDNEFFVSTNELFVYHIEQ